MSKNQFDVMNISVPGDELLTKEVMDTLFLAYAAAVGIKPGAVMMLPCGKKTTADEEESMVVGIVLGMSLNDAPPRVVELVFELAEILKYPPEVLAEVKRLIALKNPKETAVTFLSEV